MKYKPGYAVFSALLSLLLATLACAGGAAATPTAAPTVAPPATVAATAAPTQARPTTAPAAATPTVAATTVATGAATAAATALIEPAGATATRPPLSGKLEVQNLTGYLDGSKYFHVVGLITNGTDKPVNNMQVALQLSDSSGKTVLQDDSGNPTSTVSIDPFINTLDTGESSPFDFYLSTQATDTASWKPKVTITGNDTPASLQRVPVEVHNPQINAHSDGEIFLSGELVNQSDKPAQINGFAAAMLDAAGNVVGATSVNATARLLAPAGDANGLDRTPFVMGISGPVADGAKPAYYLDAVQADPVDLQNSAGLHLKLNNSYVDADNGVHIIATITNSGTDTVTVQAVAGLYDQSGSVLDADSGSTPLDMPPGSSSPAIFYYFPSVNGDSTLIQKVVSYTAQIDPYWLISVQHDLLDLTATNVTTDTSGSDITIKGTVVNTSKQTIDNPTVVVVAKGADGNLIAGDWTGADATGPVKPGAKTTFSLTVQMPDKSDPAAAAYTILVQAAVSSQ